MSCLYIWLFRLCPIINFRRLLVFILDTLSEYTLSEFSPENCIKGPLHSDNKSKNQNKINIDIAFLYKHFAYKQDYVRKGTKRKERNNSTSHINYLADQHRCFYDRDFEVDLYVFEAHDDCCYCDDDNGDDDKNY